MHQFTVLTFMQEKTWPTVAAGWQLWIPAHAINFGFIAPSMRVLYVNVIAVRSLTSSSSLDTPEKAGQQLQLSCSQEWCGCLQIAWTYILSRAAAGGNEDRVEVQVSA